MKKKRIKVLTLCLTGALLFAGCGTEPYELTEEEQGIIVHYAAHVVSKFNTNQGDGISYVNQAEEEAETKTPEPDTEMVAEDPQNPLNTDGTSDPQDVTAEPSTLNDVFGQTGLDISYTGSEFEDSYIEESVFAMQAGAGKTYLILHLDVRNSTSAEIGVDNITVGPVFKVSFVADDGTSVEASAYNTLLLNDFSTYDVTVQPGATEQAVLLFEVPDTVTNVEQLTLQVQLQGSTYVISL